MILHNLILTNITGLGWHFHNNLIAINCTFENLYVCIHRIFVAINCTFVSTAGSRLIGGTAFLYHCTFDGNSILLTNETGYGTIHSYNSIFTGLNLPSFSDNNLIEGQNGVTRD